MPTFGRRPGRLANAMVGGGVWRVGARQPPLDTCLAGVQAIALEAISIRANARRDGPETLMMAGGWETLDHRVVPQLCARERNAINENPRPRQDMDPRGSGGYSGRQWFDTVADQHTCDTLKPPRSLKSLCFVAGRHGGALASWLEVGIIPRATCTWVAATMRQTGRY